MELLTAARCDGIPRFAGSRQVAGVTLHRLADDHAGPAPVPAFAQMPSSVVDPRAFRYRGRLRASLGQATQGTACDHVPRLRCHSRDPRAVVLTGMGALSAVAARACTRGRSVPLSLIVHSPPPFGTGLPRGADA